MAILNKPNQDTVTDAIKNEGGVGEPDKKESNEASGTTKREYYAQLEETQQLEGLMKKYEITTFVPLARVVGMEPQPLYGRKNQKTGEYYYGRIQELLLKKAEENEKPFSTIEDIVKAARAYLDEKKAKKQAKKAKTKKKKEVIEFKSGDEVEYDTYKMVEGVREYYTFKGTVKEVKGEGEHKRAVIVGDDGTTKEISFKSLRYQPEYEKIMADNKEAE